jgi:hypothetical protein
MKILTFCMTYRLEEKVVNSLARQTGVDFFDTYFTNDNPHDGEKRGQYRNMMINWVKMQEVALSQNYEKVWIVESDTIAPLDALKKLLEVDAPIVSGLYASRHGRFEPNVMRKDNCPGLGAVMTWEEIAKDWGKTIECSGGATGCLLVDRSVLEKYVFDTEAYNEIWGEKCAASIDVPFMEFCWKSKFKQMARLDVICDHKRPDGMIVRPTIDGPKLSKAA